MNFKKISKVVDSIDTNYYLTELNSLIAEEYIAWLQYFQMVPFLSGMNRPALQEEFEAHAKEELDHASKLLERLNQMGLECTVAGPDDWYLHTAVRNNFAIPVSVVSQATINRDLEQAAIDHYRRVITDLGLSDPVTTDLLKEILADEEAHFTEMQEFINDFNNKDTE